MFKPFALGQRGLVARALLVEMPLHDLKNFTAWKDRMLARPAVRKVLESEQNVLVTKK